VDLQIYRGSSGGPSSMLEKAALPVAGWRMSVEPVERATGEQQVQDPGPAEE